MNSELKSVFAYSKKHFKSLIFLTFLNLSCQSLNSKTPDPEIVSMTKNIAISQINQGHYMQALRDLKDLEKLRPKDLEVKTLIGLTQLGLKNPVSATKYFQNVYDEEPIPSNAVNLSSSYLEQRRTKAAIDLLTKTIKSSAFKNYEFRERAYHNLALAYEQFNQPLKAEKLYVKALEINPGFYMSHIEIARIYSGQPNKKEEAVFHYKQANEACMKCIDPLRHLTRIYSQERKIEEARQLLISYLRLDELPPASKKEAETLLRNINTLAIAPQKRVQSTR